MSRFKNVTIIYNPNSTGNGKKNAQKLKQELGDDFVVTLTPTKYAGHAEVIASELTAAGTPHIIISSSGDGGYNEVINGVLKNDSHDHIVTAIIPSGNANDHYHAISSDESLAERIRQQDFTTIDVLQLQTKKLHRYAHSYIGFGVTPHIGKKLTEVPLNPFNEIWIVIKNLFTVRAVKMTWRNKTERYDNLLFSNVKKMSKVIKLSNDASLQDGKFEIVANKSRSIKMLIGHLVKASTLGLATTQRSKKETLVLERGARVQLDGEVLHLPKKTKVTIEIQSNALRCVA